MAHRSMVPFPMAIGIAPDGRSVPLEVKTVDETTQLALLEAPIANILEMDPPKVVGDGDVTGKSKLFAILNTGPIRAEFVSGDRLGVLSTSRRVVPLAELKFEAPLSRVAGAPVFTEAGALVGFITATLPSSPSQSQASGGVNTFSGQSQGTGSPVAARGASSTKAFGPQGLTVGYAVGPIALKKVIDGFTSEKKEVRYAALGLFLRDAVGGGAEVQSVNADSAAKEAGLQAGDVIIELNAQVVRNQIDYAKIMFRHTVGMPLSMKIRRGSEELTLQATPRE